MGCCYNITWNENKDSKYTAALVSSFPEACSWADIHQLDKWTAAKVPQLIWTDFDFARSSSQLPPPSSPDKHNNTGVQSWQGNRQAATEVSALAASHSDLLLWQNMRSCLLKKPEQQPQRRILTVQCMVESRAVVNQHPVWIIDCLLYMRLSVCPTRSITIKLVSHAQSFCHAVILENKLKICLIAIQCTFWFGSLCHKGQTTDSISQLFSEAVDHMLPSASRCVITSPELHNHQSQGWIKKAVQTVRILPFTANMVTLTRCIIDGSTYELLQLDQVSPTERHSLWSNCTLGFCAASTVTAVRSNLW